MRNYKRKNVLLKKSLALLVSFMMLIGSIVWVGGETTVTAANPETFSVNLLPNGDFSNGMAGWASSHSWFVSVEPNSGQNELNTSDNMMVINDGGSTQWIGTVSEVIALTEGTYRLSAWGKDFGDAGDTTLFLTSATGEGREEANNYWMWDAYGPLYWVTDEQLRTSAIMTSRVHFTHETEWVYLTTEFVLDNRLINVFDDGLFRVAMRVWGGYGMNITGITLTKLDDNGGQTVDKTALSAVIATAQERIQTNYTAESWAIFADALAAAQLVYENAFATQTEVDTATSSLQFAMDGLAEIQDPGPRPEYLVGIPFGNAANPENAFDGNINTYYVGGNFGYIGIDLGEDNYVRLTNARVQPRYVTGQPWLGDRAMSTVQGSVDGVTFVDLGSISGGSTHEPVWREWTPTSDTELLAQTFRFFRLFGNPYHSLEVAEIQFFGYEPEPPAPCINCGVYPCDCPEPPEPCTDCGAEPCVCPPCVTERPPGTFGNQVYYNDFSAGTISDFVFGHGSASILTDADKGYILHLPDAGGAGVTGIHYSRDSVLTPGNLYVLSIEYRTNAQASGRIVGVGAPDNEWSHWFDGIPGWAWSGIQVPVSAEWITAYSVFTAGAPTAHSPAIFLGRIYAGLGHGTWDISSITINELIVDATDKSVLASVIAAAEAITDSALYTPATWSVMQLALTTARAVYNNIFATQTEVDNAASSLQSAIDGLVLRTVDDFRAILNALIIAAQGRNESDYTASSWAVFAAALSTAQAVYANLSATIAEIREAESALRVAIDGLELLQAEILLPNGNFSQGLAGWNGPAWNIQILPNSGQNPLNTSDYMARVNPGWNRFVSDVIIINEPGFYSLNAWGQAPGTGPNIHLFLTYEYHDGAPERDRDWRWDFYWEIPNMGGPEGTRVTPSVVDFSGVAEWTQLGTVFEITEGLIAAHSGRFRVAFRAEGNTGPLYITGIRLVQVCDECTTDPCLCDVVIDRTELRLAIAVASAITDELLYTPETWAALQTALATATAVYNNQFVLQEVIDNATNALQAAIDGLVARTTEQLRELLNGLIVEAQGRNQNDYRAGTWNLLANALSAAQAVYANPEASNLMIANAYSALSAALDGLVKMPPNLNVGENLFDDGFSRSESPTLAGWTDAFRGTINSLDHPDMVADYYLAMTTDWSVMRKPVNLQGNVRYRLSAWVRGGGGSNVSGVIVGPRLGIPSPGPCGPTLCHDTWCGCEAHRVARIIAQDVPDWEFRYIEFVLEADLDGEVMLRSWPGTPLHVSDIRIEVLEVFETYGVTFGVIGTGGTLTAAVGQTSIPHGGAVRPGTNVTFTANPAVGFTIDRWEINGVVANANNRTYTATVNADIDVRVFFTAAEGVVLTHGVQGGSGTLVARANGTTGIESGNIVSSGGGVSEGFSLAFLAAPNAGYEISHWLINGYAVHFTGRLFTVAYLQGVGEPGALTFDVRAVLQPEDLTGGRFDPNSSRNTTYRGQLGVNINRDGSAIISGSGLNSVFSETFLVSMAPFGLIRFMNYTNTNNHYTIHNWNAAEATLWGEVIALANATNSDMWICVPANASDAYIRTLAELMEANLNPNITVYVEWGNEIWGFEPQRNVNRRMVQERGIPTDSRNLWATHQLWWEWTDYFHFAQRTAEIAFIFRDVFGEDYRPIDEISRIRPVLTWQVIPNAFAPMIEWLEGTTHTPTHSDPKFRNPHEYIWAVGIAPYFSEPNSALANDVDAIHRHMLNSIEGQRNTLQAIIDNANAAGLLGGAVTYEGGPHHVGDGSVNMLPRAAAQQHPLITDLMNYYIMNFWFDLGGRLYTHYRHLGGPAPWGYWGVKDDLSLWQFKHAPKYASLRWISQQPRGTTVPRPEVQPPPPFVSPILNPSFEAINPQANWNLGAGWTIDRYESADGFNSLRFQGSAADFSWFEASTPQFTLEPDTEYIFSFRHKGEAGYKVIIEGGGREYYAITNFSDVWVEYLVPFNSGDAALFNVKIGHEWNANADTNPEPGRLWNRDAWFDFFHVDENLIYNPSFERGISGWAHGLGWIGENNYEVTDAQSFHMNHSLRIFGTVTPDGLNSSHFTLRANTYYRFLFYHMGSGNFNVPIPITDGAVNITVLPSDSWYVSETWFNTAGMDVLTGNIMTSTTGPVTGTYVDNFMLFLGRTPVPGIRHTVRFNLNHPTPPQPPPSQTVNHGGRATRPADPTRTDFVFAGWFSNPEGTGTEWNFIADSVTGFTTLYAAWNFVGAGEEPETFLVEFNLGYDGATDAPLSQRVYAGTAAIEVTAPVREGFVFVEWQFNGEVFSFDTPITQNMTLLAVWIPVSDYDCDYCAYCGECKLCSECLPFHLRRHVTTNANGVPIVRIGFGNYLQGTPRPDPTRSIRIPVVGFEATVTVFPANAEVDLNDIDLITGPAAYYRHMEIPIAAIVAVGGINWEYIRVWVNRGCADAYIIVRNADWTPPVEPTLHRITFMRNGGTLNGVARDIAVHNVPSGVAFSEVPVEIPVAAREGFRLAHWRIDFAGENRTHLFLTSAELANFEIAHGHLHALPANSNLIIRAIWEQAPVEPPECDDCEAYPCECPEFCEYCNAYTCAPFSVRLYLRPNGAEMHRLRFNNPNPSHNNLIPREQFTVTATLPDGSCAVDHLLIVGGANNTIQRIDIPFGNWQTMTVTVSRGCASDTVVLVNPLN